ncbi:MAG: terminase large subunit [Erysipelotrichia bacterium]|nr:terminase large subunit [Erysipelotrichia bacterium]
MRKKACDWIEKFYILTKGEKAGQKVKLLLWQKWLIYSIFCFYGNIDVETFDEDGNYIGKTKKYTRIINDVLLLIASGNAKTTLIGFINAYLLYSSVLPSCKIYIGSNAYKQSRLCYDTTANIIERNRVLRENARIRNSTGEIEIPRTHAKLTAMSSDGSNLEGIIPAVLIIDEIHEMKNSSYAANLRKSTNRDDFLVIEMTTNGTVRGGYLDERLEEADRHLKNTATIQDDRKLFVIYEQDSPDEISIDNIMILKKSNPSLGYAVNIPILKSFLFFVVSIVVIYSNFL